MLIFLSTNFSKANLQFVNNSLENNLQYNLVYFDFLCFMFLGCNDPYLFFDTWSSLSIVNYFNHHNVMVDLIPVLNKLIFNLNASFPSTCTLNFLDVRHTNHLTALILHSHFPHTLFFDYLLCVYFFHI